MCELALTTRTGGIAAAILGLLAGCHPTPAKVASAHVVSARPGDANPVDPAARCRRYAGPPGDPDLRGLPRTHEARCCPSDYGFDPELARASCGFAEYLGESEELACVHRFRGAAGQVHELRLTPVLDLAFADAIALHERGEFGPGHLAGAPEALPDLWWSTEAGRRWAFVPGWSIVRRLGWDESACKAEQMLPVLARMRAATDDPAAAAALPRRLSEPASEALPGDSLLTLHRDPPAPEQRYPLPRAASQLVHDLLASAVAQDRSRFTALLEPGARIGLPDRRQLGAEAITRDGAESAMQRLLDGAARMPATTTLRCPALDRRVEPRVTRGEALMWCFWMSDDGLDLLAFGLRGRPLEQQADARVAYVGVFEVRPQAPIVLPGEPPPPPVVPEPALVCGDPHTSAYPNACPELEVDDSE